MILSVPQGPEGRVSPILSFLVTDHLRHQSGGVDMFGGFLADGRRSCTPFGGSLLSGDDAVHSRFQRLVRGGLAIACLAPALTVTTAGTAFAADVDPVTESRMPVTLDGSVASLAILLGIAGLVAGLWRHRRRVTQEARQVVTEPAQIIVDSAPTQV